MARPTLQTKKKKEEKGMDFLGRKGSATLYLLFDFVIASMCFAWLFMGLRHHFLTVGVQLVASNPDPTGVFNRILYPFYAIPFGFLIACIIRGIFGKVWFSSSPKSLLVWVYVVLVLFFFDMLYLALDYFVVTSIPALIPAGLAAAIAFSDFITAFWQNIIPWGVHLVVLIYAIIIQDYTPYGVQTTKVIGR